MKKKLTLLIALVILTAGTNLFSLGLGLQGNMNAGEFFAPGIAVTFKPANHPLYYALNWRIEDKKQTFGITADYWALEKRLVSLGNSPLNIFLGVGAFCNLRFDQRDGEDDFQPSVGLRIPFGFNMYLADGVIEPFIQVAPSFGIRLIPSIAADTVYWPLSAGFRIWF